jgi:ribose 1,5-bisphosphate isomerase
MSSQIDQVCEDIVSMKVRGAAIIGRAVAQALVDFSRDHQGSDFFNDIVVVARQLKGTRPTAVSLANALYYTLKDLDEGGSVEVQKTAVIASGEEFIKNSHEAVSKIALTGADLINDGDTLLTICNSSVALGVIIKAYQQEKKIQVFSAESRPRFQGRITVKQLAGAGVPVTMIVDSAVKHFMQQVDKAFVGADAITADGEVFNKIGTSQVALIANEYDRPFYVCAETYKFAPQTLNGETIEIEERDVEEIADPSDFPGVNIINPAFDRTPAKHITGIITELGVVKPDDARGIIQDMLGRGNFVL